MQFYAREKGKEFIPRMIPERINNVFQEWRKEDYLIEMQEGWNIHGMEIGDVLEMREKGRG